MTSKWTFLQYLRVKVYVTVLQVADQLLSKFLLNVCVCVRVCARARARERERGRGRETQSKSRPMV